MASKKKKAITPVGRSGLKKQACLGKFRLRPRKLIPSGSSTGEKKTEVAWGDVFPQLEEAEMYPTF